MAAKRRSSFGNVSKQRSGRYRARYTLPGTERWVNAPTTFETKGDAETWLTTVRADLARGAWLPPDANTTLVEYADKWLAHRTLKPRTRAHYRRLLDQQILPTLGEIPLRKLTPTKVREWHASTAADKPTLRAHAYSLLRTICGDAVREEVITASPCRIKGAGQTKRASETTVATPEEVAALADAVPERYQLLVLLAAWTGLRYGELAELRRRDLDLAHGVIRVRRAVVWVNSEPIIMTPKSTAGSRDVSIPPHILPTIREHLLRFGIASDQLLFPAAKTDTHLRSGTLTAIWVRARKEVGRPGLRFHDLRHTHAVWVAGEGATLAELMARLGHSSPGAAMRYQHAAKGRDAQIAEALSKLAEQT